MHRRSELPLRIEVGRHRQRARPARGHLNTPGKPTRLEARAEGHHSACLPGSLPLCLWLCLSVSRCLCLCLCLAGAVPAGPSHSTCSLGAFQLSPQGFVHLTGQLCRHVRSQVTSQTQPNFFPAAANPGACGPVRAVWMGQRLRNDSRMCRMRYESDGRQNARWRRGLCACVAFGQ